jgi:hypothetical protein
LHYARTRRASSSRFACDELGQVHLLLIPRSPSYPVHITTCFGLHMPERQNDSTHTICRRHEGSRYAAVHNVQSLGFENFSWHVLFQMFSASILVLPSVVRLTVSIFCISKYCERAEALIRRVSEILLNCLFTYLASTSSVYVLLPFVLLFGLIEAHTKRTEGWEHVGCLMNE